MKGNDEIVNDRAVEIKWLKYRILTLEIATGLENAENVNHNSGYNVGIYSKNVSILERFEKMRELLRTNFIVSGILSLLNVSFICGVMHIVFALI